MSMIRVTVWNENCHEKTVKLVREIHPKGIHGTLADIFGELPDVQVTTATLDQPDCGLPDEVLEHTDVLVWWGHMLHDQVPDGLAEKIQARVYRGMGLIALHSGVQSKIFKRLMGTTCDMRWKDDTYERLFCIMPSHPIAAGIPEHFELGEEECYGEPFAIPVPDETIFLSWFDIGEVLRSGCTWYRGYGRVFYFQPGHETNRSYLNPHVRRILQNALYWAAPGTWGAAAGSSMIEETLEERRKAEK